MYPIIKTLLPKNTMEKAIMNDALNNIKVSEDLEHVCPKIEYLTYIGSAWVQTRVLRHCGVWILRTVPNCLLVGPHRVGLPSDIKDCDIPRGVYEYRSIDFCPFCGEKLQ